MELAIKSCDDLGKPANSNDCDYLWALAYHTIEWDSIWDQFSSPSFSQDIEIGKGYTLTQFPPLRAIKAREFYKQYLSSRMRIDKMHLNDLELPPITGIGRESLQAVVASTGVEGLHAGLLAGPAALPPTRCPEIDRVGDAAHH